MRTTRHFNGARVFIAQRHTPLKWRERVNGKQRASLMNMKIFFACTRVMARYSAQDVANLVDDSDFDADSDSDVEEDPDFPLPTVDSDDEVAIAVPSSTSSSRGGIYDHHLY